MEITPIRPSTKLNPIFHCELEVIPLLLAFSGDKLQTKEIRDSHTLYLTTHSKHTSLFSYLAACYGFPFSNLLNYNQIILRGPLNCMACNTLMGSALAPREGLVIPIFSYISVRLEDLLHCYAEQQPL